MQENNPFFGWILQENPNFWEDNGYKKVNPLNYHYYHYGNITDEILKECIFKDD